MNLFLEGKLNPQAFDAKVRRGTHDLTDVLTAAARTRSPSVESTHVLIALGHVPDGVTADELSRLGMTPAQWESGLAECAGKSEDALPPAQLTETALHPTGSATLRAAEQRATQREKARIGETVLLLSALENLTASVARLFRDASISANNWRGRLEESLKPVTPLPVFEADEAKTVKLDSFSPRARKVLSLMQTEAESLGYEWADPRHLVLALIAQEEGATRYCLHHQGKRPQGVQEAVMLSLSARARRTRSTVPLDGDHLQPILRRILTLAADQAAREHAEHVAEPHLLRAFLQIECAARRILEDEKLDVPRMLRTAQRFEIDEAKEAEAEKEFTIADIETVRDRLNARLVGQADAADRILPYIQRMRFGFSLPDRPEGVFLFCGPSGCGKTEMAKELARAVYGSEENLIFLEMGQFNARESINIFIGAPPGYVGYGQGKLTNGLRDKPNAVVLFDEVEKAHPLVLDALLRFLDEGRIDDPAGPLRDGSQCIVVLTSNVGAEELGKMWREIKDNPDWRTLVRRRLRKLFKRHRFRVEFLNRVDELILFRPLDAAGYAEIARRFLRRDLERLSTERQIHVELEGVYEAIGAYCAEIEEGARAAHRLCLSVVVTPVINFVLKETRPLPVKVRVTAKRASDEPGSEPYGVVDLA